MRTARERGDEVRACGFIAFDAQQTVVQVQVLVHCLNSYYWKIDNFRITEP